MHEMISGMVASQGVTLPENSLPIWLAKPLGNVMQGWWQLFKLKSAPPLSPSAVMLMSVDCTLNDGKARTDLGKTTIITRGHGLSAMTQTHKSS
ncbi:MAG: hypothetical protein V3V03_06105, partial [Hyphomonadaceae bacterium]